VSSRVSALRKIVSRVPISRETDGRTSQNISNPPGSFMIQYVA
jgi:hypothetical protein